MLIAKSLRNKFIKNFINKKQYVGVYLNNGICLKGVILSYTEESILLKHHSTEIILRDSIQLIKPENLPENS